MLGRRQSATCGSDGRIVAKRPFFPSAGRHLSAPVLSGDLRVFSLPDILLLINTNHKSGLDEVARLVTLSDFDRILLGLVDGRRTVRDIVTFARRDEFETWQGLHALLSAGVIRVQLLTLDPAQAVPTVAQHVDDADLERAIDQYGGAVAMLLARASAAGPSEAARLRKRLREATFEQADLLKEMAIDPDGRIDRRVLLANVADFPAGQRARVLQGALERLLRLLMEEMKGTVSLDDVASALEPEE
ncbi:MAG: hypothetical protein DMF51_04270 [Acidobacteria bacterium]|nr:MAG: hypothetical protein DMF51_04270 [Acidobacteriota bacterium]